MWYIAAPFFNTAQIKLVKRIEEILDKRGIDFFSPRESEPSQQARKQGMTPELAEEIFAYNTAYLNVCEYIVAVLDWAMPPELAVAVVDEDDYTILEEVNVPDAGTVWELGYAYARTDRPTIIGIGGSRTNLMLSGCCDFRFRSVEDLVQPTVFMDLLAGFSAHDK